MSIQNLFGHLCSGTGFAHDREMEEFAIRQVPRRKRDGDESQIVTSSREGSVQSHPSRNEDTRHVSDVEPCLDPFPQANESKDAQRNAKRRRHGPAEAKTERNHDDLGWQRLHAIRRSFQDHLDGVKRHSSAVHLLGTTQAKRFESSSDDSVGELLLDEMREPANYPAYHSESGSETQISLSDAAFESQSPHRPTAGEGVDKVKRRKEAYRAAKELGGTWERDHGLVSSFEGHREEEVEL